jgi:hypothetical protein
MQRDQSIEDVDASARDSSLLSFATMYYDTSHILSDPGLLS